MIASFRLTVDHNDLTNTLAHTGFLAGVVEVAESMNCAALVRIEDTCESCGSKELFVHVDVPTTDCIEFEQRMNPPAREFLKWSPTLEAAEEIAEMLPLMSEDKATDDPWADYDNIHSIH